MTAELVNNTTIEGTDMYTHAAVLRGAGEPLAVERLTLLGVAGGELAVDIKAVGVTRPLGEVNVVLEDLRAATGLRTVLNR